MGGSCGIKKAEEAHTPKALMETTTDWQRIRALLIASGAAEASELTITVLQSAFRGYLRRKRLQPQLGEILELSDDENTPPICSSETDIDPMGLLTAKTLSTLLRLAPLEMKKIVPRVVALGTRALQGGGVYVGEWSAKSGATVQKGRGKLYGSDGSYTEGYWKNSRLYYRGRYIYPNGDLYEGNFDHGVRSGRGIFESFDVKTRYQGEWKNGRKHGQGQEIMPNETEYLGTYRHGWKSGNGLMRWKDGTTYQGEFKKDQLTGYGTFHWADGRIYHGSLENGKMHGSGHFTYPDGKTYEGEYMYNKKHGKGVYRWEGNEYDGEWRDGQMHGLAYLTLAGGERKMYLFEHGKVVQEVSLMHDAT